MISVTLNARQMCDLELLLCGAFAPLQGYMTELDYNSVVSDMRLTTGELWPMPIVLSVSSQKREEIGNNGEVLLVDEYNNQIAKLFIASVYQPDLVKECECVFGSTDTNHPYINYLLSNPDVYYLGGTLEKINDPLHYDFTELRLTPEKVKQYFADKGWTTVVGFQTRNPMHRSHMELTLNSMKEAGEDAKLLLHPVVGITQACDVDYATRIRCYKKLKEHYPANTCIISLLPLAMRMAGPREAMWHALIRKNYGCTHFVVGRDHAGPSFKKANGDSFFGPYDAHELLDKYSDELGINIIKSVFVVYEPTSERYYKLNELPEGATSVNISGTQLRAKLRSGEKIPEWFSFPDVVEELRKAYKPLNKKGFCVYFTGLSGAGKTTLSQHLKIKLEELIDNRAVTLLDGDVVRQNLSKGLGFSRSDRSTNVQRVGYVASEIVKHGGIAICANIAPYEDDRQVNRKLISKYGGYFEVFVDTPLDVCEQRDIKGLYKLAREGVIKEFTGISDPYETPVSPDLVVKGIEVADISDQLNQMVGMIGEYVV